MTNTRVTKSIVTHCRDCRRQYETKTYVLKKTETPYRSGRGKDLTDWLYHSIV